MVVGKWGIMQEIEIKTEVKQTRQRKPKEKWKLRLAKNNLKSIHHPIYIAYEKYLLGDTKAIEKLEQGHRETLEKCIKVSSVGKTAYQAAQETGIPSDAFFIMGVIKKRTLRKQYKDKQKHKAIVCADDVLAIVQSKPGKCDAAYVTKKAKCDITKACNHLSRLKQSGKVKSEEINGLKYWSACESLSIHKVSR